MTHCRFLVDIDRRDAGMESPRPPFRLEMARSGKVSRGAGAGNYGRFNDLRANRTL